MTELYWNANIKRKEKQQVWLLEQACQTYVVENYLRDRKIIKESEQDSL